MGLRYEFCLVVYVRRFRRCSSSSAFVGRAVGVLGGNLVAGKCGKGLPGYGRRGFCRRDSVPVVCMVIRHVCVEQDVAVMIVCAFSPY